MTTPMNQRYCEDCSSFTHMKCRCEEYALKDELQALRIRNEKLEKVVEAAKLLTAIDWCRDEREFFMDELEQALDDLGEK